MEFSKRLENLLQERGLTQKQVSKDLHIAPTTFNGYIKGNREPDYSILVKLADYFEVSTDFLLGVTNIRKYAEKSLDVREGDLVGTYRCLHPEKQELLLEQAHLYRKYELKQKEKQKENKIRDKSK